MHERSKKRRQRLNRSEVEFTKPKSERERGTEGQGKVANQSSVCGTVQHSLEGRQVVEEAALLHQRKGELEGVHDPPESVVTHLEPLAHEHVPHDVEHGGGQVVVWVIRTTHALLHVHQHQGKQIN